MKSLIVAASAIAMVAATPAFAATASGTSSTIAINAEVAQACGVGNHRSGADQGSGDQTDIVVDDFADGTGQFRAARTYHNKSFGNVWCNTPATWRIEAAPLTTPNTNVGDTSSFTNRFDIQVSGGAMGYVGGGTIDTSTGTNFKQLHLNGAYETGTGQYSAVDITVLPTLGSGNQPLRPIAGHYTGSVKITVTAG